MSNAENKLTNFPAENRYDEFSGESNQIISDLKAAGKLSEDFAHDWLLTAHEPITLPYELATMIPLSLRDEGNQLLEETRLLGLQHCGKMLRYVQIELATDLDFLDLKHRIMRWSLKFTDALMFKNRNNAKKNPLTTYLSLAVTVVSLYKAFVTKKGAIYHILWESLDASVLYEAQQRYLVDTELCLVEFGEDRAAEPVYAFQPGVDSYEDEIFYTYERSERVTSSYLNHYLFDPLIKYLKEEKEPESLEILEKRYIARIHDLAEAYPYLISGDVGYEFALPNGLPIYFSLKSLSSIGSWAIADGLHYRIMLEWNGDLTYGSSDTLSLEKFYGREIAVRVSLMLVEHVHAYILEKYLEEVAKQPPKTDTPLNDLPIQKQTAVYASWLSEIQDKNEAEELPPVEDTPALTALSIPPLRRQLFFKILGFCGVRVEQGKGSESKLIRDGKPIFVLGNHGYKNPTVPRFLAINILRRLEITHAEWQHAYSMA